MREGMTTLRQDGIEKVLQGLTDLLQVLAAAAELTEAQRIAIGGASAGRRSIVPIR
jgi:hypothetical protein